MPGVSNTCLFAPAPNYKLNKGFFLGFLFKPLGGLRPPPGLNKKASEKYPLSITYSLAGQGLVSGTIGLICYCPSVCQSIWILCPGQISHKDRPNSFKLYMVITHRMEVCWAQNYANNSQSHNFDTNKVCAVLAPKILLVKLLGCRESWEYDKYEVLQHGF